MTGSTAAASGENRLTIGQLVGFRSLLSNLNVAMQMNFRPNAA
ncbi:hypothetical protein [Pseudodonghicola xiamenensis]|nr:hypothetical protein [Pseudodonghicola xiamenensis]